MNGLPGDARTLHTIRRILLATLALGIVGTAVELALQKHTEDASQLIPVVLLGASVVVLAWHLRARTPASVAAIQVVMVLFIASGAIGVVLHYQASLAFQLEIDPSARARDLVWKVLEAKAPPALAPGVMAQLGLLGLAYTYRYPRSTTYTQSGERR
jgi:predicted membrane channel-forming protein YqfA (hemolysin III family)